MPYISKSTREVLRHTHPNTPGELNYAITQVLIEYLRTQSLGYSTINDCIGALECAKLEFIRRVVAPYEDLKLRQNGDVYPDMREL